MLVSMLRNVIACILIAVTPATLVAADADTGAMLYGKGKGVWLNGKPLPRSSAVFPGDLIQTQAESVATLDASGSGVIVFPDSLVKFEGNAISLQHGSVNVATSKGMVALAQQVTVTPASNTWTQFDVADTNGTIQIIASKGSLNVNCGKGTTKISEGEQATSDESGNCNKKKRSGPAPLPVNGGILTDPYIVAGALIGGGLIVCLLLCTTSQPLISQFKP